MVLKEQGRYMSTSWKIFSPWRVIASTLLLYSSLLHGIDGSRDYYLEGKIESLMLPQGCPSHKVDSLSTQRSSLRISQRLGPCTNVSQRELLLGVLRRDGHRVSSLNALVLNSSAVVGPLQATLPARLGLPYGTRNYLVTLSLGSPPQSQTVLFDTGSTVSWVQCKPCLVSCHPQADPVFSPAASSTYQNHGCSSASCSLLSRRGCTASGDTCLYSVLYGDGSTTTGYLAQDTLTLAGADTFPGFVFGCGQDNQGLFGREAGLLGLSRGALSLSTQTSSRYGRVFSYCLPSLVSGTGDLTFGPVASPVVYTPMLTDPRAPSLYFLNLVSISVGGRTLPVSAALFSAAGTLIDSGTVITRLPGTAYAALRAAFRAGMVRYTLTTAVSILDTCYDLTGLTTVSVPRVALTYGGGATVNLGFRNIMVAVDPAHVCLAFAGNSDDASLGILGNVQQGGQRVVYDVSAARIGFGSGTCG